MTAPPPVLAVFCAAEDPLTGALCRVIGCRGEHSSDGQDAWTTPPRTDNDPSRRNA